MPANAPHILAMMCDKRAAMNVVIYKVKQHD